MLDRATETERAALYASMGVSAVYNPERNEVRLGIDPVASTMCRRGDLNPHALAGTSPSSYSRRDSNPLPYLGSAI